jgi:SAM-dependent methyltransferase
MASSYRSDLAHIHDTGFGDLAINAARMVIKELERAGDRRGLIVDLGCGGGISARIFCDAGYDVLGVDLSEALLGIARERVPEAVFRLESFTTTNIPRCVAVTAIGEVFNYVFDEENGDCARSDLFHRVFAALAPNGLFVFDMAGPDRAPANVPQRTFAECPDWAVLAEIAADDARRQLTRRITTFRKIGVHYRRDDEMHRLHLVDPRTIMEGLKRAGFVVRTTASYDALTLPTELVGFLAQKPNAGDLSR